MKRYAGDHDSPERLPFYLGLATVNWSVWHGSSLIGIFCASFIPSTWGMSFAGNIALIAIVVPMIEKRPSACAAVVASVIAVATFSFPYRLNIVLSVIAAVLVGMYCEKVTPSVREKV